MSWIDFAALALIVLAVADGARSGLIVAALETAALVGAATISRAVAPDLAPHVRKIADLEPDDRVGAAHAFVFGVCAVVFFGAVILLKPATKRGRFPKDGFAGGALGAVNGLLASLLVFALVVWPATRPNADDELAASGLAPTLRVASDHGFAWLFPEYLPRRLAELDRP